jgi:hypothetical protein
MRAQHNAGALPRDHAIQAVTRVQLQFGELLDSEIAEGSGGASVGLELAWP